MYPQIFIYLLLCYVCSYYYACILQYYVDQQLNYSEPIATCLLSFQLTLIMFTNVNFNQPLEKTQPLLLFEILTAIFNLFSTWLLISTSDLQPSTAIWNLSPGKWILQQPITHSHTHSLDSYITVQQPGLQNGPVVHFHGLIWLTKSHL